MASRRGAGARGSRPALRWLHSSPGRARLHVKAGEAVRQGDRPRGEVPPLRGCRKSCVSRAKQAPRRDATTCSFMNDEELSPGRATGYCRFRINERQQRLVGTAQLPISGRLLRLDAELGRIVAASGPGPSSAGSGCRYTRRADRIAACQLAGTGAKPTRCLGRARPGVEQRADLPSAGAQSRGLCAPGRPGSREPPGWCALDEIRLAVGRLQGDAGAGDEDQQEESGGKHCRGIRGASNT